MTESEVSKFAFKRTWGPDFNCPKVLNYKRPKKDFVVIAGPCSVESEDQIMQLAELVSQNGGTHLRGGVFRAGTYPGKKFGYVEFRLIEKFNKAARNWGLKNIVEILDYTYMSMNEVAGFADCFQVGCRQMQNYSLLKILAAFKKPIFLKRNPGSTVDEWLGAAEHLLNAGAEEIYLIERGSSTHMNHVRWDLSISAIPAVQAMTDIPVIVDASHGTGRRDLVGPMTLAGVAAGADGVLIEVHQDPEKSLSDADQAIDPFTFKNLMSDVQQIRKIVG